jgi:enoyl-CoA hydratase
MTDENAPIVRYELDGDVAVIRIDDGKANALSHTVIDAIEASLHRANAEAKAVVLVGREGKFSAGFDLKTMTAGPEQAIGLLKAGIELAHSVFLSPIPVVIAATGHGLAMGAILLMAADLRIGAEGPYKIGMNEVRIGMPVPRSALAFAENRLARTELVQSIQLATVYDPAGAVATGFLDQVVPLDQVEATALDAARELAEALHPNAFKLTREYLRQETADKVLAGLALDAGTFVVST